MKIENPFYDLISTPFGIIGIIWWERSTGPRVLQTLLDKGHKPVENIILKEFPNAQRFASPNIIDLGNQIESFLKGDAVTFNLEIIAFEVCSKFQQKVLLAEYEIPRGWVSTYGRIARHIKVTGGSRAVGRALSKNPFPIIIPCHRAVQVDGNIGGYQGGSEMKRRLLEMEGVGFTTKNKVIMQNVYY